MRKSLYFKPLFYILFFIGGIISTANGQHELYSSRTLDLEASMTEGLYHQVLSHSDPYREMNSLHTLDRQKVISLLHTRYPELTYALESIPKMTISGDEIAALMVTILKEEVAAEVTESGDRFWEMVADSKLSTKDAATFQFLYAYELFKEKRFREAQKILDKIIKARKGEYEYAFYYSGLIDLIEGKFDNAQAKLKKIGDHDRLSRHTPYYLAAAHYGSKDYSTITTYYAGRLEEQDLYNIQGIAKIVAYAQFKKGDYQDAIASLAQLKSYRDLTGEENYVLGIAYQKTGDEQSSSMYLTDVASKGDDLSAKAKYEHGLNMANQGKNGAALKIFEELMTAGSFDRNELHWNLAILNGRLQNYDKLAFHAVALLDGTRNTEVVQLLTEVLDNLENEALFEKVAIAIHDKAADQSFLKTAVYNKALTYLKVNNKGKANHYFNLLATIDPLVEERGVVAAWKGIMAYQDGNYKKAIRLLTNYNSAKVTDSTPTKLDFDVAYFLGYAHFKMRNHSAALGHFSASMELLDEVRSDKSGIAQTKDDLFLRMGDSYFLLDEYESAQRAYTRIVSSDGINKDYALWQNATIAELEGRPFDQILILDELISEFPNSHYYHRSVFSTANALFGINRFDRAATFYNRVAASSAPTRLREESQIQLGLISVNAGDYDRAANYFTGLIDLSKDEEIVTRSNVALKEIYADYTYDTDAYLNLIANDTDTSDKKAALASALINLAKENQEKGNYPESIEQFNRFISDHSDHELIGQATFFLGQSYLSVNDAQKALAAFRASSELSNHPYQLNSFEQAERIAFDQIKDYKEYANIHTKMKQVYTEYSETTEDKVRMVTAYLKLADVSKSLELGNELLLSNALKETVYNSLLTDLTALLMNKKQWSDIEILYTKDPIKKVIDKNPKLIYQRALVYFNSDQLELATTSITDHYDTLLNEPAWLAKSIILLSDINVLQDDPDSASIALEALINSKSAIPPGLIKIAEERLKALKLQN